MIDPEHLSDALKSIQSLIVQARFEAYNAGAKNVGDLLDDMELLPEMLADERDRSQEFREALAGIAQKHQRCRYIAEQYLGRAIDV